MKPNQFWIAHFLVSNLISMRKSKPKKLMNARTLDIEKNAKKVFQGNLDFSNL